MKIIVKVLVVCVMLALCACNENTRPDPNYVTYVQASADSVKLSSSAIDSLVLAAQACSGDPRCVENVVAFAALAKAGSSNSASHIEPYRASPSLGSQLLLAAVGQIAPLATAAVAWHQADTQARVSIAQTHYLDDVLSQAVNVVGSSKPSITVGGNYGQTGSNIGGNQTNTGGDYIPGSQVNNSGNYGEGNRQGSPGPIGPTCTGDTCQGTPAATTP